LKSLVSPFDAALAQMRALGETTFGPQSYQDYCAAQGSVRRTAEDISVDSYDKLNPALRANGVMVLRLGRTEAGATTAFGLVKAPLKDFFLMDEEIFRDTRPATYVSDATQRELLPFQLLPAQTETSVVNLAIATGLLGDALGVDRSAMP
jgi:hypothetical protein